MADDGTETHGERRSRSLEAPPPVPRSKRSVVRRQPLREDAAPTAAKASTKAATLPTALPRNDQVARLLLDVGSGPHLKMDMEEPIFMPPGAAASAAADEGGTELAQLQALEKSLRELRNESQSKQANELNLRAKLSEAEFKGRMLPWLVSLLLLATGVAVWLALRLRGVAGKSDKATGGSAWWSGQPGSAEGPVPEPPLTDAGEFVDLPLPVPGREAVVNAASAQDEEPLFGEISGLLGDMQPRFDAYKTQPLSVSMGRGEPLGMTSIIDGQVPAREVSVEELLDLEQQADFFIALGQEDAAGDLLMSHLRSTGGLSPLPYTKLLEIYRRQGDRSAYERIRARFNRRFNVYAPDWDVGPSHGRTLEDYPDVIAQIQELWPSHLNAMAVLEAMLFRNDERQELFDLPAYKDVLLLYSLARDLYQQEGVSAADVDLLLPLGDHSDHVREPLSAAQRSSAYDMTAFSLDLPEGGKVGEPGTGPDSRPTKL
jgi:pilus assembly protein FimV